MTPENIELSVLFFPTRKEYLLDSIGKDTGFYRISSGPGETDPKFPLADTRQIGQEHDRQVYQDPAMQKALEDLKIENPEQARVLVIVDHTKNSLVGNFLGPIVLNPRTGKARQVVLNGGYSTREKLEGYDPSIN